MSKKVTPDENESKMQNPNKGKSGTNKQYSQNQGNRGKQLNPNQTGKKVNLLKSTGIKSQ